MDAVGDMQSLETNCMILTILPVVGRQFCGACYNTIILMYIGIGMESGCNGWFHRNRQNIQYTEAFSFNVQSIGREVVHRDNAERYVHYLL